MDDFLNMVEEMRSWQRVYFNTRGKYALKRAMELERRVDTWLLSHPRGKSSGNVTQLELF